MAASGSWNHSGIHPKKFWDGQHTVPKNGTIPLIVTKLLRNCYEIVTKILSFSYVSIYQKNIVTFAKNFRDMNQVYQVAYKITEENRTIRDMFSIHKTLKGATAVYEEIVEDCNFNEGYTLLSKTDKIAEYRINSRPDEQRLTIYINKIPLQP